MGLNAVTRRVNSHYDLQPENGQMTREAFYGQHRVFASGQKRPTFRKLPERSESRLASARALNETSGLEPPAFTTMPATVLA